MWQLVVCSELVTRPLGGVWDGSGMGGVCPQSAMVPSATRALAWDNRASLDSGTSDLTKFECCKLWPKADHSLMTETADQGGK
jgi:hypothetical protein